MREGKSTHHLTINVYHDAFGREVNGMSTKVIIAAIVVVVVIIGVVIYMKRK